MRWADIVWKVDEDFHLSQKDLGLSERLWEVYRST